MNHYIQWKRAYQSPLILQCFAVYFSAIKSSKWLVGMYPDSENPATNPPEPRPALALAAAAGERALKLIAEGRITIESIKTWRDKKGSLIKTGQNPYTGRRAIAAISFSEDRWGTTVSDYLVGLDNLKRADLHKIIKAARGFTKVTGDFEDEEETVTDQRPVTERSARARINLGYDSDSDNGEDGSIEEQPAAKGRRAVSNRKQMQELYTMQEEEELEELNDPYADEEYDVANDHNIANDHDYDIGNGSVVSIEDDRNLQADDNYGDEHAPQYSDFDDTMYFERQAQHPSQDDIEDYMEDEEY